MTYEFSIGHNKHGYYASLVGGNCEYLHTDSQIHKSTEHNMRYTGYFQSVDDIVRMAINQYGKGSVNFKINQYYWE